MGQINVIRVARAYITSRLESIQIPAMVKYYSQVFHVLGQKPNEAQELLCFSYFLYYACL